MNFFDICPFWARALWDDFSAKTGPDDVRVGLVDQGDLWDDFAPEKFSGKLSHIVG